MARPCGGSAVSGKLVPAQCEPPVMVLADDVWNVFQVSERIAFVTMRDMVGSQGAQ
jgi:hypothetical protein